MPTSDPGIANRPPDGTKLPPYVLITPARNEAAFIEQTILSVVGQTVLPVRWTIVSDGSEDGTDEIVARYAGIYPWIELVRMPARSERHFGGKVLAFQAGYQKMRGLCYDVLGSLDADIAFDSAYFDFLLKKFAQDASLGVAGTPFREGMLNITIGFRGRNTCPELASCSGGSVSKPSADISRGKKAASI